MTRILKLTGTALERGRMRGEELRALIHEQIERMKYLAYQANSALNPGDFIQKFVNETGHLQAAEKWTPELLDEVKGISQGAGVNFHEIFVMSCLDEIWRYSQSLEGEATFACSSLGCFKEEYSPALLGQNLDTDYFSKNLGMVFHIQGEDQPEAFVISHAASLGWMGLNRTPLGVCVNTVSLKSNRNGLPVQFIAREIIRKNSLAEAVDFLSSIQPGAAQNFMIGDAEKVVDFEGSASGFVEYVPYEGARRIYHTNHPFANFEFIPNYPVIYPNSLDRYKYLDYRLKDPSKPITIDNIKGILSSHSGPICRHSDHKPDSMATWVSVVYSLSVPPELHVAFGNPCDHEYECFSF